MSPKRAVAAAALAISASALGAPPATPTINEPELDGQVVNGSDVHMETAPFSDPDGDNHLCSDWQIWTAGLAELAWETACITGLERVHTHLGDGTFMGSHAGRTDLLPDSGYVLFVRHRDDSGAPGDDTSSWAARLFTTSPLTQLNPLEIEDVADSPAPTLLDAGALPVVLPQAGTAPAIALESATSQLLLRIEGFDGASNFVTNPAPLGAHEPASVRITTGTLAAPLVLPASDLTVTTDDGDTVTIYLPSLSLTPGEQARFWIAETGATYAAGPLETEPAFGTLAGAGAPAPWVARQSGYVVETIATGFQLPVNIAFVPSPGPDPHDPAFYVTELYGTIKVVLNDGDVEDYATGLLNFDPTGFFPGSGEQGVTGIAVDSLTGDVFAAYLYDDNGPHYPKVVRFSSSDGGVTSDSQTTLLDMVGESQGQSHQISNLSIGPDNKLYVHMGDGFDASTAQNLNSFRGKILRLNLDGSAPTDNPFYNAGDGITATDYVYVYGVRNPFGGAARASDGVHYQVENGPSVDRFASALPGVNYLWDGSNASMFNLAIYNWDPAHAPTNIAFVQPSTFGGSGFPAAKYDHAFVAESGPTYAQGPQARGKRIVEFVLDGAGNLVSGPNPLIEYAGTGRATVVGLAAGPDGLYFTDLYKDQGATTPIDAGASVHRVRFVGAASFAIASPSGPDPHLVSFTNTSTVPNPTSYRWTFGDGAESTGENPQHTYTTPGLYSVRLEVVGPAGIAVAQTERAVRVGAVTPVALVGASIPPAPADQAIADHLAEYGLAVTFYDDEPANRPTAATIGASHDLMLISSTVLSGNIAGEFAPVPVPVIFWEQALLSSSRMGLASPGATVVSPGQLTIVDNSHPITQGLGLTTETFFASNAVLSHGATPTGAGVQTLAHLPGDAGAPALMVAETGATLLDGSGAAARRVFFFIEDGSYLSLNPLGAQTFDRAVCWALGIGAPVITDAPDSTIVPENTPTQLSVVTTSALPAQITWTRNGQPIPNAGTPVLDLGPATLADSGVYDVTITNLCGSVSAGGVSVAVTPCPADLNNDGILDNGDIATFIPLFLAQDLAVDFNGDGLLDNGDIAEFITEFLAGC